ncbi:magnesium chelatase, partial [Candidatus Berkelbacteria bacterium CG11_big_fil_rev_8_21_14_0_20_40_23]
LEDGVITVSRASGTLTFPAKFMLIASSNPCPCGYLGDPKKECSCTPMQIIHYQKKLSGPLLDRIDMKIVVERFDTKKFAGKVAEGESDEIRAKVTKARNIQRKRYAKIKAMTNADLKIKNIEGYCQIPETEKMYLIRSMENSNLSARGYHKILKIARTIADLDQSEKIKQKHLFEALSYYDNQALNM